ncbi:MAG: sugar ABC transporter permease [Tagaea sp.]|nr:sugar ABC transporter permease [Tagaea sp.]
MSAFLRAHPWATIGLFVPTVAIALVLLVWPFLNGVLIAFTDASPKSRSWNWVGFENFDYIFSDRTFWEVARNSLVIVLGSTFLATVLGFLLALLLNENLRGTRLFRTMIFQGWVVPWIAIAVLWGWLFNFDYGIVNHLLVSIGVLDANANWLADGTLATIVVMTGFVWRIIPFMMITFLAALQGISQDLIEAARIDGATYLQRLRHIVLPLVRNVVVVAALLQAVRLFQELTLPLVVTAGGPINATTTLSLYTYKLAFQQWDFGLAGAVGVFWSVALVLASALFAWSVDRRARRAER